MAIISLFLSILWCAFVLTYVSASASKNSEFKVGPMDSATALRINKLLRQNFDNDFSWDDPELAKLLYSDATDSELAIKKRALLDGTPFGAKIGPLIPFRQCIGCSGRAAGKTWTIDDFTLEFFLQTRIVPLSQLKDTCVFYGRRSEKMFENGFTEGLSKPATTWACLTGRKTIWQLWPYNTVSDDGNFWVLDNNKDPRTRNWLQNVWDADVVWKANNKVDKTKPFQGPRDIYFSHMSAAVAWSCSGTVYIMAEGVWDNLPSEGIWPLVEYPVIQQQYGLSQVTTLIAVPFNQTEWAKGSWKITNEMGNWRYLDMKKDAIQTRDLAHIDLNTLNWTSYLDENGNPRIPTTSTFQERSEALFRDRMGHMHQNSEVERRGLKKRDSCLGGYPYQEPDADWFNNPPKSNL